MVFGLWSLVLVLQSAVCILLFESVKSLDNFLDPVAILDFVETLTLPSPKGRGKLPVLTSSRDRQSAIGNRKFAMTLPYLSYLRNL